MNELWKRVGVVMALSLWAGAATAQDVFTNGVEISNGPTADFSLEVSGNTSIVGRTCIGQGCGAAIAAGSDVMLYLEATNNRTWIEFSDQRAAGGSIPGRDWRLRVNDSFHGGVERFSIEDLDAGTIPFTVQGPGLDNAFWLAASGDLGLGTSMPQRKLHVVGPNGPGIRLEQDTSGGFGNHRWDISSSDFGLQVQDVGLLSTVPFAIQNGALHSGFVMASNDSIGMGTSAPDAALHLLRNNGQAQVKVEEISGTQTARALVNLVNNGRPDIVMTNTGTGKEWAFGAGSNFVLKTGAVGSTDAEKTLHLKLFGATGDLEITGQLITGGGSCGGGCDRVFDDGYKRPSIRAHAEAMFAKGYLPNVGPTVENQPINVSDKLGRMLNELEHAHIYIAELEGELSAMKATQAEMLARLKALEE